ncbi:MAG: archaea-specific SMC-related protein, partial [Halobacteriaceae archaeon]
NRRNGTVVTEGDPYLEDPTLADLFAFLLEANEARRAITGGDLRDVIMRPVNTSEIKEEVSELQDERNRVEERIKEIENLKNKLPKLENRKKSLKEDLKSKENELSQLESEIEQEDEEIDTKKDKKQELERKVNELSDLRSDLENIRFQIESQQDSIQSLEKEKSDVETELNESEPISEEKIRNLKSEVNSLRSQKEKVNHKISQLRSVIQFNQEFLDENIELFADLQDNDDEDSAVTDQLVESNDELVCWTCGNEINTDQIELMLDKFKDMRDEYVEKRSSIDEEIRSLQSDIEDIESQRQNREQLQSQLQDIDSELETRREELVDLKSRRDNLIDEIEELESEVESLRATEDQSELIELHKEANRLEVEIDKKKSDIEDVENEIERIENQITEQEQLEAQLQELENEIEQLRTKIDRIERSAVEQFNEHMETILDILEYDNLERIWLERKEREERDGRRKVTKTNFEMHVVRSIDDGTVYEDKIDHLSESEREVVGLVFALAGYLAHDLHEEMPFMLIDSVEAIDPSRLSRLIEYFTDYADYLVAALLEDDAQALPDSYNRISEI